MKKRCSVILLVVLYTPLIAEEKEPLYIPAVCVVPVSDLLTDKPILRSDKSIVDAYQTLPITNTPFHLCSRITQLLYNERVTIIEQDGDQVYVETDWWYFRPGEKGNSDTKVNRFWMLAAHLRLLDDLPVHYQKAVPGFFNAVAPGHIGEVVGLFLPWKCEATGQKFSIGTRFTVQSITYDSYQVLLYNPYTNEAHPYSVPKNHCILENAQRTTDQKRHLFVTLIRQWAHFSPPIPYVLGGASYQGGQKDVSSPYNGFDCSGMIRRAARLAGIAITATNSYSMLSQFEKRSDKELVVAGDLLYWKGHIMVVTSTHKHLLAEARGYTNGHGIVHEIPYKKELEGIKTTKELACAVAQKKKVKRLDPYGKPYQEIKELVILRLL